MIYITGDCHNNFERFNTRNFPEQKEMTKDDYVIICGDFGGVWNKDGESKMETSALDWLDGKVFTTLFVDGNHENFDRLYAYPVEMWHGGKVHKIRPSVVHLMRGQVFELEEKKIFTFGGARSHDIQDGILEIGDSRIKKWIADPYKMFRVNHLSWWSRELPNDGEMEEGIHNLEENDNIVDFIITHCTSTSMQDKISDGFFEADKLTDYFDDIRKKTSFSCWIFGHYHDNLKVTERDICLFEQIVKLF